MLRDVFTVDDPEHHQYKTNNRDFCNFTRTDKTHIHAHKDRNRNRGSNTEHTPRTIGQGFDDHQCQYSQDDNHYTQGTQHDDNTGKSAEFLLDHFTGWTTVTTGRNNQHQKILYRTGQYYTDQEPDGSGQITHLRGQDRTDQRACTGNCSKVMAKQNTVIGWHIVQTIGQTMRRG